MPTRLTRLDCYNRHRLFEHKGAARRLFVSRRRRHGAECPGRVPGLPPQLHAGEPFYTDATRPSELA